MGTTKSLRHALHTRITTLMDGNGIEAADIHRFRTARLSSNPTHIVITSHRDHTEPFTQSDVETNYQYLIHILARYNDLASEEAAEDFIDDAGDLIIEGLGAAQETDAWDTLIFHLPFFNRSVRLGADYRMKTIIAELKL